MKTFKLLSYLLLITMLSAGFVSCSDDDDDTDYATSIVGTWELIYSKGWENNDGDKEILDDAESGEFHVFESDGTGYGYEKEYPEYGYHYTWSIKNNILTIREDGEIFTLTIKHLSSSKMELYENWGEDGEVTGTYRRIK